ncbi:hypothetical protein SDC9_179570 [bioreactor metagenome]|uniref:Uncharacterized protein n=1 Tax=bioreactor metagenome TaxID=1076179 RepID=A0A645H736_9ZZZZ
MQIGSVTAIFFAYGQQKISDQTVALRHPLEYLRIDCIRFDQDVD